MIDAIIEVPEVSLSSTRYSNIRVRSLSMELGNLHEIIG